MRKTRRTLLILILAVVANVTAWAQCTIMPSNPQNEAQVLGLGIDGYLTDGVACLRHLMNLYPNAYVNDQQISSSSNGSWNKPPMTWTANALDDLDPTAIDRLKVYADNQLNPSHDLWGKEILSWLYWWPMPTLAEAFQWIPGSSSNVVAMRQSIQKVLQAHVGTLSVFSTGDRVLTPSVRTLPGSGAHDAAIGHDYFLKTALGLNPPLPSGVGQNGVSSWPFRITQNVSHGYMSTTIRQRFDQNYRFGTNINWVVAKLNALNVSFRVPVHVWRYQNGDFATMLETNTHSTKDPIYAVTRINGVISVLGPQKSNSVPQAWRNGNKIHTSYDDINAPTGTLLYYVRFDASGVTRVQ